MKGMVNFSLAKKEKINSIISDRISNNLVTEEEGYLLDATQGKVLKDEIGNTDISAIGNGTLTGALKTINSNLESKLTANSWRTFYKRNMSGGKLLVLLTDITTWYIGTNTYHVDFTGIVSTNRQHWYGNPSRAVAICYCSIGYYGATSGPYLYTTNSNFRPIIVKYTNPEDDTDIKYYLAILRSFKIDSGQNIDMLYSMQVQSGISTGLMTCIPFDSSLTVPDGYEIIKDNNSKFIEASSAITLKGSSGSYSYDNIKTLESYLSVLNTSLINNYILKQNLCQKTFNDTTYNAYWMVGDTFASPLIVGHKYKLEIDLTPLGTAAHLGLWDVGGINKFTKIETDGTTDRQIQSVIFGTKSSYDNTGWSLFNHTYKSDNTCGVIIHSMKIEWYGMYE